MNKRGILGIIAILLIIILVMSALIVIWNLTRKLLKENSEMAAIEARLVAERLEIVSTRLDSNNPSLVIVNIKKSTGKTILNSTELVEVPSLEADIISVVDLSGSMVCSVDALPGSVCFDDEDTCVNSCGGEWLAPLNAAKDANNNLISSLLAPQKMNRMAIVTYAKNIIHSTDITNDNVQLSTLVNSWDEDVLEGGTCICCGINEASLKLMDNSPPNKPKVIIVMTDGIATNPSCEEGLSPGDAAIKAACDANAVLNELIIYSVGLGDSVVENTLKKIAECGNGEYFHANVNDIVTIYNQVAQKIQKKFTTVRTINYLKIIFYNATDTYQEKITDLPEVFATKKYVFDLQGKITNVKKVEIYPVVITSSGKESIGIVLDSEEIR